MDGGGIDEAAADAGSFTVATEDEDSTCPGSGGDGLDWPLMGSSIVLLLDVSVELTFPVLNSGLFTPLEGGPGL